MRPWESVSATRGGGQAESHGRMDHPMGSGYAAMLRERLCRTVLGTIRHSRFEWNEPRPGLSLLRGHRPHANVDGGTVGRWAGHTRLSSTSSRASELCPKCSARWVMGGGWWVLVGNAQRCPQGRLVGLRRPCTLEGRYRLPRHRCSSGGTLARASAPRLGSSAHGGLNCRIG
jgi:hypothetical protein